MQKHYNKFKLTTLAASLLLASGTLSAQEQDARAIAERLVDEHFQNSTLSREEQIEELMWFANAAEPFRGMDIQTVAEGLTTHVYESEVLAEAFSELTGINITHNIIGEGDVVDTMQNQMQSGNSIYDGFVNAPPSTCRKRWRMSGPITRYLRWIWMILLACSTAPGRMAVSTNYQLSSLPTSTGSVMTGLQILI